MRRKKRRNTIMLVTLLVLGISIGFAALATTLKINGNATLFGGKWDIYWDHVGDVNKSDTTVLNTPAEVDSNDNKQVNFAVTFNQPGDYYEFQVDAVNNGSLDAIITLYTTLANGDDISELPDYIVFTTTYADGSQIAEGDLLAKKSGNMPTTKRYKVKIEYSRDINPTALNGMPDDGETYDFTIGIGYSQKGTPYGGCPGEYCKYAFYTTDKVFSPEGGDVLDNGTSDYTTLKDDNNNQRVVFIGHILDSDNRITEAYICGLYGYIDGTTSGSLFCIKAAATSDTNFALVQKRNAAIAEGVYGVASSSGAAGCYHNPQASNVYVRECIDFRYLAAIIGQETAGPTINTLITEIGSQLLIPDYLANTCTVDSEHSKVGCGLD